MIRAGGIAMAAGGLLARVALGCLGFTMLLGWIAPSPRPAATTSSGPGDPARVAMTVALRVPEGAHASHLTVVDESGRELAVVTRWISGMTTVVSPRRGRLGVGYHLGTDGSASVCVQGRERVILPDARADGTPGISRGDLLPAVAPRP